MAKVPMVKTEPSAYRRVTRVVLAAAFILMLPLVAMQVTDEMRWDWFDFSVAGVLLVGTGLLYELAAMKAGNPAYRAAAGVALAAAFLLVWINLAVGIIGEPEEPANAMYFGVLAVGGIGAAVARFRPGGMARAMLATALAQGAAAVAALVFGFGAPGTGPLEIVALNGMFAALFAGSALLFRRSVVPGRRAGRRPLDAGPPP